MAQKGGRGNPVIENPGVAIPDRIVELTGPTKLVVGTREIAESFDITRQAILPYLDDLEGEKIRSRTIGRTKVWYPIYEEEETESGDTFLFLDRRPTDEELSVMGIANDESVDEWAAVLGEALDEQERLEIRERAKRDHVSPRAERTRDHSATLIEICSLVLLTTGVWVLAFEAAEYAGLAAVTMLSPIPIALVAGLAAVGLSAGILGYIFAPIVVPRVERAVVERGDI